MILQGRQLIVTTILIFLMLFNHDVQFNVLIPYIVIVLNILNFVTLSLGENGKCFWIDTIKIDVSCFLSKRKKKVYEK